MAKVLHLFGKPEPEPDPHTDFDFDEESLNLTAVLDELETAKTVAEIRDILSRAMEFTRDWPDDG